MLLQLKARLLNVENALASARHLGEERTESVTCVYGSRATTVESESDLDEWVIIYGMEVTDLE
jgi:hypothetical protein